MATFESATITSFFEEIGQIGLSNGTRREIAAEGIATPDDLVEFTKDGLESMFHNLRKSPKTLVFPVQNGAPLLIMQVFSLKFSHMSSLQG